MKKENNKNDIEDYYKNIEIPKELSSAVKRGIEKGKKEKRNIYFNKGLKIACSFLIVATLGILLNNLKLGVGDIENQNIEKAAKGLELPKIKDDKELLKLIVSSQDINKETSISNEITGSSNEAAKSDYGAADYSKTNNQVENVEEGDKVKTDGKYIYTVKNDYKGGNVSEVIIVKGDDPTNMKIETKITLEGFIQDIYITQNKLLVISQNNNSLGTDLSIYNKENIENLKLERKLNYSGQIVNSRLISNRLIMITNNNPFSIYPMMEDSKSGVIKDNGKTISLPRYYDSLNDKEEVTNIKDISYFPDTKGDSIINIASIDINNYNEKIKTEKVLASAGSVYSTADNIYITASKGSFSNFATKSDALLDGDTLIYKYSIKNGEINPVASGEVKGRLLNQFSMDENNNTFRIATTKGFSEGSTNNLYILDENLKELGKLEGLAPRERIYSVRFLGDTAYMVTFKQVDPLFVIDLRDSKNPKVTGELKIPGFSNYLHPLDGENLIGFGEDRDEEGRYRGLKLSIFDVKDGTSPKEKSTLAFGGNKTHSEVNYNHKAFFLNKEKSIIGIPMVNFTDYGENREGIVFLAKYSEDRVMSKFGELKFNTGYYGYENRIIYIKNNLYVVTNEGIFSYNIDSLESLGKIEY